MKNRIKIHEVINHSSELYDRNCSGYPAEFVEDVINLSEMSEQGRILHIGWVTYKMAEAFAIRGYYMDCLVKRNHQKDFSILSHEGSKSLDKVKIISTSIENLKPKDHIYDIVLTTNLHCSAFYLIDYMKCAEVLKPSGAIAEFSTNCVKWTEGFIEQVQSAFDFTGPSFVMGTEDISIEETSYIGQELFQDPIVSNYACSAEYNSDQFQKILFSYSDNIGKPPDKKWRALNSSIAFIIQTQKNSRVIKNYNAVLKVRKLNDR
jgi:hypothetical protein